MPVVPIPGKPLPVEVEADVDFRDVAERLFKLRYISHHAQQDTLLYFPNAVEVDKAVAAAKQYCLKNNYRFVYLEPAIQIMETE
jgi:hypothetical protein